MRTAILSAHTDDAIFSLGDYIQQLNNVTIVSVFSGIPPMSLDNGVGYKKHNLLRHEHEEACKVLGVEIINGDFVDDVYQPRPTMEEIAKWLLEVLPNFDNVIAPIGIHHPDHILLRETLFRLGITVDHWYMDLPYAVIYPSEKRDLVEKHFKFKHRTSIHEEVSDLKNKAIQCYKSQIQSDHILGELLVPEEIYD